MPRAELQQWPDEVREPEDLVQRLQATQSSWWQDLVERTRGRLQEIPAWRRYLPTAPVEALIRGGTDVVFPPPSPPQLGQAETLAATGLYETATPAQQRNLMLQGAPLYLQTLSAVERAMAPLRVPAARAAYGVKAVGLGEPDRSWSQVWRDQEEGRELPTMRETFLDIQEQRAQRVGKQPGWFGKLMAGGTGLMWDMALAPDVWAMGAFSRGPVVGGAVLRSTARKAARRATQAAAEDGMISRSMTPLMEQYLTDGAVKFGEQVRPADLVVGARLTESLSAKMTGDIAGRMGMSTTDAKKVVETAIAGWQDQWATQWRFGVPFTSRKITPGRLPKGFRKPRMMQDTYNKNYEEIIAAATKKYDEHYVEKIGDIAIDKYPTQAREDMIQQIARDMESSRWWQETFRPRRGVPVELSLQAQTLAARRVRMQDRWGTFLSEPFQDLSLAHRRHASYYIAEGPYILPTTEVEESADIIAEALSRYFERAPDNPIVPGGMAGLRMPERIGRVIERTGEWRVPAALRRTFNSEVEARAVGVIGKTTNPDAGMWILRDGTMLGDPEVFLTTHKDINLQGGIRGILYPEMPFREASALDIAALEDEIGAIRMSYNSVSKELNLGFTAGHEPSAAQWRMIDGLTEDMYSRIAYDIVLPRTEEVVSSGDDVMRLVDVKTAVRDATVESGLGPVRIAEMLDDAVRPVTETTGAFGVKGNILRTMPSFMDEVGESGIVTRIIEPPMMVDLAKIPSKARDIIVAGEEHRVGMRMAYQKVVEEVLRLQALGMDVRIPGDLGTNYFHKMLIAGSRTPYGSAEQAILHKSLFRTPIEAAALRQLFDDPDIIRVFNTPEARGLASIDDVPLFVVDIDKVNRAYARQMANIQMAGDIREMTIKYGVQTHGTPADIALGYSGIKRPYFPDIEYELPTALTEFLDHTGAVFHPEQSRWRQFLSYPRRDALMSLTWLSANVVDQLPSAALSGIATPKGYLQGMQVAAKALAYDIVELAKFSEPRTFLTKARLAIARRIQQGLRMGGADDALTETIVHEMVEGEASRAMSTGLARQLQREAPGAGKAGWPFDTVKGQWAERQFSRTLGIGVRAGSVMEDFARMTQYAAMRIDGLSPDAAMSQLYKGWVAYDKTSQAVIDEWGRNASFFWTYQRQRIPQYGEALTTRPWLMYIPFKAKDIHARSIANEQQRAAFRWGAPEHMKSNPDWEIASWNEFPFSYMLSEMGLTPEEEQYLKHNVMCTMRPRYSMRETMGDINDLAAFHKLMEGEAPEPRVVEALMRRMAPPLQAYAYLEQDRYKDAIRAMCPSLSKWIADGQLRVTGMSDKAVEKRRKRYKIKPLYGRVVNDPRASQHFRVPEIDTLWWKLDLMKQSTKMPWGGNWLAKGRIVDFLYMPATIERMTYEQREAVGIPHPPGSRRPRQGD